MAIIDNMVCIVGISVLSCTIMIETFSWWYDQPEPCIGNFHTASSGMYFQTMLENKDLIQNYDLPARETYHIITKNTGSSIYTDKLGQVYHVPKGCYVEDTGWRVLLWQE